MRKIGCGVIGGRKRTEGRNEMRWKEVGISDQCFSTVGYHVCEEQVKAHNRTAGGPDLPHATHDPDSGLGVGLLAEKVAHEHHKSLEVAVPRAPLGVEGTDRL